MSGTVEFRDSIPPSGGDVYYYPGATRGGANSGGRILRIGSDDGRTWHAVCREGSEGADGLYRFDTDSARFVVVCNGCDYCLSTDDPVDWKSGALEAPNEGDGVRFAAHHQASDTVLLFGWFAGVAFGPRGKIWTAKCPYASGWSVVSCDDDSLYLDAVDDPDEPSYDVALRVADGLIVGPQRRSFDARR